MARTVRKHAPGWSRTASSLDGSDGGHVIQQRELDRRVETLRKRHRHGMPEHDVALDDRCHRHLRVASHSLDMLERQLVPVEVLPQQVSLPVLIQATSEIRELFRYLSQRLAELQVLALHHQHATGGHVPRQDVDIPVVAFKSLVAIIQAVRSGLGRSILPSVIGDQDTGLRRTVTRPDLPALPSWEVWLLTHPELRALAWIEAVSDWLAATIAQASSPAKF